MVLYVRIGMHLLYYGSLHELVVHSDQAMTLLRQQTERLGRLYDDPASRSHIRPFILEFDLQDTLHELVKPDPTDYQTFNEFFSREIKPEARPIADPEDVRMRGTYFQSIMLTAAGTDSLFGRRLSTCRLPNDLRGDQDLDQRLRFHAVLSAAFAKSGGNNERWQYCHPPPGSSGLSQMALTYRRHN